MLPVNDNSMLDGRASPEWPCALLANNCSPVTDEKEEDDLIMVLFASLLLVMLGGGLGAVARFGCQKAAERWIPLPGWTAIFCVNILGSFLIGIGFGVLHGLELFDRENHMTLIQHFQATQDIQMGLALFVTGFCGGYTTFSTFSLDNLFLIYQHPGQMIFNIMGSLVLATLAAWGGLVVGGTFA